MTADIILRPWKKEDAAALTAIANNKKVWLNVRDRFPHPYTIHNALDWIKHNAQQHPTQHFAIIATGKIAGSIGVFLKDDVYKKTLEVGYFIGEQYWGKGVATKAVELMLGYIPSHFEVVKIYAEVFEHNKASMRVLEKNGFTLESKRIKSIYKNNLLLNDQVWVKFLP